MRLIKIWCFGKGVSSLVTILTLFALKMNFNPTFISFFSFTLETKSFELRGQMINLIDKQLAFFSLVF